MELIPILSTIILVATISTFILAVGAYILYKVQEKRADQYARREAATERAEFIEPANFGGRELVIDKLKEKPIYVEQHYRPVETVYQSTKTDRLHSGKEGTRIQRKPLETRFAKFTSEGYVKTDEDKNAGVISWR